MSHFATATAFVEHVWSVGVSSSCLLCFVRVLFCVLNVLCGLVLRLRRGLCCWLLVVVECSPLPDIPAPALFPLVVHSAPFPPSFRRAGPALSRLASSAVDDGGDRM